MFAIGETALVVRVPEAEAVVGQWRARYDPSARYGVPAHVTVLYPFLNVDHIGADLAAELGALFAAHPPFEARFGDCGRFPGVLYLAPEPEYPFRALTDAVVARWPDVPPYGGRFDDVIPHLTVADGAPPATQDAIEVSLADRLPVTTRVAAVELVTYDGIRWQEAASFPLG